MLKAVAALCLAGFVIGSGPPAQGLPTDGRIDIVPAAPADGPARTSTPTRAGNEMTLIMPAPAASGSTVSVQLWLQGDGQIHGLSLGLVWNKDVLALATLTAGPLLASQASPTICILGDGGSVDVAVLGGYGPGLSGDGLMAIVTFDVLAAGDPTLGVGSLRVRDGANQAVDLTLVVDATAPVPDAPPAASALRPNYPNPFNPSTTLRFGVARAGRVELRIYGLDGRLVRTVFSGNLLPGNYRERWDGRDDRGRQVSSGMYLVRLHAPDQAASRRITLVK